MNMNSLTTWILFNAFVVLLLWMDLRFFHRENKEIPVKSALRLSAFWIALALLFNVSIIFTHGSTHALDFFTAYLVEKSLSVDNLFVFLLIFNHFQVPKNLQHKVLYYGILGALIMRGVFIFLGVTLLQRFEELIYVLGAFLVLSGAKLLRSQYKADDEEEEDNRLVRWVGNLASKLAAPNTPDGALFVRSGRFFRPTHIMFVVLCVELCDVIFALDSIPAVLAISSDPFIVYSSNVCAILGLRALFFALAGLMTMFRYLDHGLAIVLMFVGAKMVLKSVIHIPSWISLICITAILATSVILSIIKVKKDEEESEEIIVGKSVPPKEPPTTVPHT